MELARIVAIGPAECPTEWITAQARKACSAFGATCVAAADRDQVLLVIEGMASDVFLSFAEIENVLGQSNITVVSEMRASKLLFSRHTGQFSEVRASGLPLHWADMGASEILLTLKRMLPGHQPAAEEAAA